MWRGVHGGSMLLSLAQKVQHSRSRLGLSRISIPVLQCQTFVINMRLLHLLAISSRPSWSINLITAPLMLSKTCVVSKGSTLVIGPHFERKKRPSIRSTALTNSHTHNYPNIAKISCAPIPEAQFPLIVHRKVDSGACFSPIVRPEWALLIVARYLDSMERI